jgi:hypothetical protein
VVEQTDAGKARCWLKIALNNHTIESSIMVGTGSLRCACLASCSQLTVGGLRCLAVR